VNGLFTPSAVMGRKAEGGEMFSQHKKNEVNNYKKWEKR
jgi:hypothetical protein